MWLYSYIYVTSRVNPNLGSVPTAAVIATMSLTRTHTYRRATIPVGWAPRAALAARVVGAVFSPCECEQINTPDFLYARLFPFVVLADAAAVTMDEASCLSWYLWSERDKLCPFRDCLDARLFPFVVLAVAPAVTMDEASCLSARR